MARASHKPLIGTYRAVCLSLALAFFSGTAAGASTPKIVFLPQDVSGGYDHRGGTPDLLGGLEKFVAHRVPRNYVKADLRKLLRAGVKPYYIYSGRYCEPIGRVLGANVFVMARLTVVSQAPRPADEVYDVEAKAFSSETGREVELVRAQSVRSADVATLTEGREDDLLRKILSIAGAGS
jgi:hypothetical protein